MRLWSRYLLLPHCEQRLGEIACDAFDTRRDGPFASDVSSDFTSAGGKRQQPTATAEGASKAGEGGGKAGATTAPLREALDLSGIQLAAGATKLLAGALRFNGWISHLDLRGCGVACGG